MIAISFLIDYFGGDKYKIEHGIIQNILTDEENEKFVNNPEYNPNLTFSIDFQSENSTELSERFVLFDMTKEILIERNEKIMHKVSDAKIIVLYKCEDEECSLNNNDKTHLGYILCQISRI